MADDVEMMPVDAAEPPKADPLAASAAPKVATIKLTPVARKPVVGGAPTAALKPGLKLPSKPGLAGGLKLPPKPGLASGLKLPPKPGLKLPTVALKPGLKLPPKPMAVPSPVPSPAPAAPEAVKPALKLPTAALKPGLKLPPKPVIRKPGATVVAVPLPKPVVPVAVDAQGVGKLPTVEAKSVDRADTAPAVSATPSPLETLKSVTQKLKGITQEIPQQAILHKTGIIAEGAMSETQKEASKHKTARISLSDAMGVAPVKNETAPMKTIRIKRPVDIAAPAPSPAPSPAVPPTPETSASVSAETPAPPSAPSTATVTQRKTLKISRPGSAVRPAGKFGVKRPMSASTVKVPSAEKPLEPPMAEAEKTPVSEAVADIPEMPTMSSAAPAAPADEGPAWLVTLSTLVQAAACVAIGVLAWFLYQNTQIAYF